MSRTFVPLWLLLVSAVAGQEAPPAAPSDPATPPAARLMNRPATVNHVAITDADVLLQLRLLGSRLPAGDAAQAEHAARRAAAEEVLLAGEALRLGVELTDREVDAWWEDRADEPPDYAAMAAATGSTIERQKELTRRAALAELYLLHRCGLRGEQGQRVAPDPVLVRTTTITPGQLREAYGRNRALFDRPETVTCEVWLLPDALARAAAEAELATGNRPGPEPVAREVPLPETRRVFPEDVALWLDTAQAGQWRALDERSLLRVAGREAARPASFAQVQEPLRGLLLQDRLTKARQHLVDQLRGRAMFWPEDLFDAQPRPPAPAPAPPPAPVANPAGAP
jgi:hypothetical protein